MIRNGTSCWWNAQKLGNCNARYTINGMKSQYHSEFHVSIEGVFKWKTNKVASCSLWNRWITIEWFKTCVTLYSSQYFSSEKKNIHGKFHMN